MVSTILANDFPSGTLGVQETPPARGRSTSPPPPSHGFPLSPSSSDMETLITMENQMPWTCGGLENFSCLEKLLPEEIFMDSKEEGIGEGMKEKEVLHR